MKSITILTGFLVLALALASCGLLPAGDRTPSRFDYDPSIETHQLMVNGLSRKVLLYVPKPLPETGAPVVIMLHSEGGTSEQAMETITEGRWNELAFREKFIVAYPQAWNFYWNDCRLPAAVPQADQDDVAFILYLIDWLMDRYPVDPDRIFAAGHSNGGMMAMRLGIEAPQVFSAVFSNNGLLPDSSECANIDRVSHMMLLVGTQDPLMPYQGGPVGINPRADNVILSAEETIEHLLDYLEISGDPEVVELPDRDKKDGSTITQLIYENERSGLWFYRVDGGGHAWPGKEPYSTIEQQSNGNKNRDVQAADLAWQFFMESVQRYSGK